MRHGYYTKTDMENRGWTKKLFEIYLPEPHKKAPNPVNPDYAPMCLYDPTIVKEIEADPGYQQRLEWTRGFGADQQERIRKARERKAEENSASK